MYPPEMKELIKKVEETRPRRIEELKQNKFFPRLTQEESQNLLRKFHPDYKEGTKRKVLLGPNKGDILPNEIADALEANPCVELEKVDLNKIEDDTDVLIIGGGGAGSSAALIAQENGAKVIIATKLRHGDANTMMAEGGIQAADKDNDSPALHYLDTMGGGHFTNTPSLLKTLVNDAPSVIEWLEDLGLMFDKEDDGTMKTLLGGGTSRKRMHSSGDMTGAEIMRTLRDEVKDRSEIKVIEFSPVIELLLDDKGNCAGAILLNLETNKYLIVRAKTTILTTGGFGRLHLQGFPTTNHYGATADGLVLAYRVGCSLVFMDASQFHPTGVIFPEQNVGLLITEKVRGSGAEVINIDGEQFVYPLEPRDVESSAIIQECLRGKGIKTPTGRLGVWLDSPLIEILQGEGSVKKLFPAKYRQFARHGIDISKEPMLIYPTLHYQNGGIKINEWGETEVSNLYAAGEVSGGVHGRNRLMGNSLLDILVFGRRAGKSAAEKIKKISLPQKLNLEHVKKYKDLLKSSGIKTDKTSPVILPDYVGKIG